MASSLFSLYTCCIDCKVWAANLKEEVPLATKTVALCKEDEGWAMYRDEFVNYYVIVHLPMVILSPSF